MTTSIIATLEAIAKHHLGLDTLDPRGSDDLDFHSLAVSRIGNALAAAYDAGCRERQQVVAVLGAALHALNTAPRFRVGNTDSYAIASRIHRVLNPTTGDNE